MSCSKTARKFSADALFRSFVAVVLCAGLMIPTNLTTVNAAYAATSTDCSSCEPAADGNADDAALAGTDDEAHRHGTVSITSDAATDNVITLKVGETADVTVAPYVHRQFQGCGMSYCPSSCEEYSSDCFVAGFGCKCYASPFERTANVTSTVADASVVSASDVVAGDYINADNLNLKDSKKPVTKNGTVTLTGKIAGTTTVTVAAATDEDGSINAKTGDSSSKLLLWWHPATTTFTVNVVEDSAGATISAQNVKLRQSGSEGSASVSVSDMPAGWKDAVSSIEVAPISADGTVGDATTLDATQYSVDDAKGRITFNRTEEAPVFTVAVGEGDPVEVATRWGGTMTYPQSKKYQVTVHANGFADTVGTITCVTGASETFSIVIDEDGDDKTTDDRTVVKTYTKDEMDALSSFSNGSSQCGMTGFRTFSAKGVSLEKLFADANVSVSATDAFKLDTTDDFGSMFTYDQLFGDRYFLQSIYDDQEVKDTYAELVKSDDEAGATVQLRRLLAQKALEDNSIAKPMMSANYAETLIGQDEVASAVLPTEENTQISSLVGAENQYRFTYGISLVQDDCTVTFDAGEGVEAPATQTVKSHLMTSTENTTIRSTYWNNAIIVYRNAAEPTEPSTAADTIAVPETPVRDGYVFAGWYTQDGSETGEWGDLFDFTANDRTVDVNTTLYAKWIAADEVETLSGHSAKAWREAEYGNPPEGNSSNAGQHVDIRLDFDGPVAITDADALSASLNMSLNGMASKVFKAEGNSLVITTTQQMALMAGICSISFAGGSEIIPGITVDGKPASMKALQTAVDTGLEFEVVSVTEGTDTTPASTTFKVTHGANVRSMNHIVWLTNSGENGTGESILPNSGGTSQSTTAHHHAWYKFTNSASAVSITSNAMQDLNNAGYDVTTTAEVDADWNTTVDNGGLFTITAQTPKAGEILSASTYTDSFFQENGLSYGQDVTGIEMPRASKWTRLAGQTRLDTSAAISAEGFEAAETVIVASSQNFPDALSATALAGRFNAPILLTDPDELSAQVSDEIKRLGAKKAIIVGGDGAVKPAVEAALEAQVESVGRIYGETRYETAEQIYQAGAAMDAWGSTAIVTTGAKFADALSISSYAYAAAAPIFLANEAGELSESTLAAIKDGGFTNIEIVGGDGVVSVDVEKMFGEGVSVERLAGQTRYDTSAQVASFCLAKGMSLTAAAVASGANFPDALSGGALCGANMSVLLLVGEAEADYTPALSLLESGKFSLGNCYVLGGDAAISDELYAKIEAATKTA